MRYVLLPVLVMTLLLTACNGNKERVYKYIEVTEMESPLGGVETDYKPEQEIKAESDSAAYLQGFQKFCLAVRVYGEIQTKTGAAVAKPSRFKLMDDKGTDLVPTLSFAGKDEREKEIIDLVFKKK
ncbi:MAG: hypothetical protein U0V74_17630 [Chitinophagales bacterium]